MKEEVFNIINSALTNVAVAVSIFVAASVLIRKPELSLGYRWPVIAEAMILYVLGFVMLAWNIIIASHKLSKTSINKWIFVIGGTFFATLVIHITGALAFAGILSAVQSLQAK